MSDLQVIERNGQRVLTTAQLADAFGTDTRVISNNFTRNRDRYVEGKQFFLLEGDELREFKATIPHFDDSLRRINRLYLWTEKGSWLHAKSLNTERAWEAYEHLVDDYYDIKQMQHSMSNLATDERSVRMEILKTVLDHEERLLSVEKATTIDYGEQRQLQRIIGSRIYEIEPDSKYRSDLFRQVHREIKDRWGVGSYRDIRRVELDEVVNYIKAWKPRLPVIG